MSRYNRNESEIEQLMLITDLRKRNQQLHSDMRNFISENDNSEASRIVKKYESCIRETEFAMLTEKESTHRSDLKKVGKILNLSNDRNPEFKAGSAQKTLTNAHIALICIYKNEIIHSENEKIIWEQYGRRAGHSGKLVEKYNYYMKKPNRTHSSESKADAAKEKLLVEVINFLENNNYDASVAKQDLEDLRNYMNL